MRCPECGHTNVAGSLFCERCGADLSSADAPEPAADAAETTASPEPADTVACPVCGHANDPAFTVCERCGEPLYGSTAEAEAAEPTTPQAPSADGAAAGEAESARRVEPAEPVEGPTRRIEAPGGQPTASPATASAAASAANPAGSGPVTGQMVTGPQRGKVKLVVEQGMVIGKQFMLNSDSLLVGREDPADHVYPDIDLSGLDEGYVHRRHAQINFEGSFLFVTHLGGHNRTYVNNRPIADNLAHPLNIGDTVRFGKVVLRLCEV